MDTIGTRLLFAFGKSTAIYLALWSIRYRANWDYNLSPVAKFLRWTIVLVSYVTAASLPGKSSAYVRVIAYLVGLCFLCWPNFAYHLDRLIQRWPSTQGFVVSSEATERGWNISYNYFLNEVRYGGVALVQPSRGATVQESYPEGKSVMVQYDPYNPEYSNLA